MLDDLGHGAVTHGDDRRAAGQRLDHHQTERLRPLDGEQRAAGALVELDLGLVVDLAAKVDVVGEERLHLLGVVLTLGPFVHLAGHDQALVETPRHLDGGVGALVGDHAADEQEVVVLLRAERHVLHVDGVGDGAHEAQVRESLALVLGDGDEGEVVTQRAQDLLRHGVGGAVKRGHDRSADEAVDEGAHGAAGEAVVVVDHVELPRLHVGLEAVHHLEVPSLLDLLERGAGEDVAQARLRGGVAAGEQRDVVTATHEALGEQADDELDAAVALGGQGEPGRGDHGDAHRGPPGTQCDRADKTRGRGCAGPHATGFIPAAAGVYTAAAGGRESRPRAVG